METTGRPPMVKVREEQPFTGDQRISQKPAQGAVGRNVWTLAKR